MDKVVEQKYKLFQDAYNKSQITKDIDKYLVSIKIENVSEYRRIKNINFKIFIDASSEFGLVKDSDHIFHANTIYNCFKDMSSIDDITLNKMKINMIKNTIIMFFR